MIYVKAEEINREREREREREKFLMHVTQKSYFSHKFANINLKSEIKKYCIRLVRVNYRNISIYKIFKCVLLKKPYHFHKLIKWN